MFPTPECKISFSLNFLRSYVLIIRLYWLWSQRWGNRLKQHWIDWLFRRNSQNREAQRQYGSSLSHEDWADDLRTQALPHRPSGRACLPRRRSDCRLRPALHDLRTHGQSPFTGRFSGHAEARGTFSKRYSFRSHVLFDSDEFDLSELFWNMVGRGFETDLSSGRPLTSQNPMKSVKLQLRIPPRGVWNIINFQPDN
jgi:hypothetical protein